MGVDAMNDRFAPAAEDHGEPLGSDRRDLDGGAFKATEAEHSSGRAM
jgi:hypothetical protein